MNENIIKGRSITNSIYINKYKNQNNEHKEKKVIKKPEVKKSNEDKSTPSGSILKTKTENVNNKTKQKYKMLIDNAENKIKKLVSENNLDQWQER